MKILVVLVAFKVALVLSNDLEEFVISNREFTANFYTALATKITGNFVGGPTTAAIALSMLHAGATNHTAQQLSTGLSLPNSISKIQSMMEVVLPKLKSQPGRYTLKAVNKMCVSHDLDISNDFNATAKDVFNFDVESVDFKQKGKTVAKINAWVKNETEKQIKRLLKPSDVTENTKAIVLIALYFQATWLHKFNKSLTHKDNFYTNTGVVEVDMMETTASFEYCKCDSFNAQFLRMPFVGGDLSMVVILPNNISGLASIEANIYEVLGVQNFTRTEVHVQFPKINIDTTVKLVPILENLGIVNLFKPGADLSGITSDPTQLFINNLIQRNHIGIDEDGINANTVVSTLANHDDSLNREPTVEYDVQLPFVFYIESPAGVVFVGRYAGEV